MFICIAYVHFDRIARDRRAIRSGAAAPYVVHVRWGGRVDFEVEAALPAATVRRVGTAEAKGRRRSPQRGSNAAGRQRYR